MKKTKKLVFTEYVQDGDYISYKAESPFGTYYIDHNLIDKTFSSYCDYAEIGDDLTLIDAIKAVNTFHDRNLKLCLDDED